MKRHLTFAKHFFKDINIGAITPTTSYCVRRVCKQIDFSKKQIIVEYGPGDGPYTDYILSKMTDDSILVAVETNREFVQMLKDKDRRLKVVEDSAENIKGILEKLKIKSADYVISGIPFSFFDKKKKIRIIRNTRDILKKKGQFLVYQYSFHVKKYLQKYFRVKTDFEILNFPPYFIMRSSVP